MPRPCGAVDCGYVVISTNDCKTLRSVSGMFHRLHLVVMPFNVGQFFNCKSSLESCKINSLIDCHNS